MTFRPRLNAYQMMPTPSNTFHGCFGCNRFSVGRFVGDGYELFDELGMKSNRKI
jgi:hypothetical protein